ncbi:MAG: hypothetical protein FWG63_12795 [Defluviitaleaceae bacterium]|nr:hypothetical protein [Defluviitaleaceae bacterium]
MIQTIFIPILIVLAIGLVLGAVLGVADKFLKVALDERLETLIKLLPGFNCGACGNPGCAGHAQSILAGTGKIRGCKPMKDEQEAAIREYLAKAPDAEGNLPDLSKL